MSGCGCHSKSERKIAENEVKITFSSGMLFFAETRLLNPRKVMLKFYGNDKSAFWRELTRLAQEADSWQKVIIEVDDRYQSRRLRLELPGYVPGSGEYPFEIMDP